MPDTAIELKFGNGDYRFWLSMREILQLERECDKSVLQMHEEMGHSLGIVPGTEMPQFLGGGLSRYADIRATIRLGLIGGNAGRCDGEDIKMTPLSARELVETYVDGRPISETLPVAWAILNAAVMGVTLKKKAGTQDKAGSGDVKASAKA